MVYHIAANCKHLGPSNTCMLASHAHSLFHPIVLVKAFFAVPNPTHSSCVYAFKPFSDDGICPDQEKRPRPAAPNRGSSAARPTKENINGSN